MDDDFLDGEWAVTIGYDFKDMGGIAQPLDDR